MTWSKLKNAKIKWGAHAVPRAEDFDDVYFNDSAPAIGLNESSYVFLDGINAPHIWQNKNQFSIAEFGFGAGLNFFNTWHLWRQTKAPHARLNYISFEQSPLTHEDIKKALSPFSDITPLVDIFLAQYPPAQAGFHTQLFDNDSVRLTLIFGKIGATIPHLTAPIDAWYLDGFAPSKNPDMWDEKLFEHIAKLSSPKAKLATFTAASDVRRKLIQNGFQVTKQKGFGKKREHIVAQIEKPPSAPKLPPKSVAIIGAGIAGLMLAKKLKTRGIEVTIIDQNIDVAQETSSNPASLISPKLALGTAPYDRLHATSFLHAVQFYNGLENIGHSLWLDPRGLVILAKDQEDENQQVKILEHFKNTLNWHDRINALQPSELGQKYSLVSKYQALFIKEAGAINNFNLIKILKDKINLTQGHVHKIIKNGDQWLSLDPFGKTISKSDAVVLACGVKTYDFIADEPSPLMANRGQLSLIDAKSYLTSLPSIGFEKYLTAPFMHNEKWVRIIGASHKRLTADECITNEWQKFNTEDEIGQITALEEITGTQAQPHGHKIGLRATTIDHMPIVGEIPNYQALEGLPSHRQKIFPRALEGTHRQNGFYIFTGLGARGFQLSPLLAEFLASQIMAESLPLDKDLQDALDPARFALRRRRHEKL